MDDLMHRALFILPLICVGASLSLLVFVAVQLPRRARALLRQWAADQHLELLHVERRYWRAGPYGPWYRIGNMQRVFFVAVRDSHGEIRRAYVRVGSLLLGVFDDEVAATWEAPSSDLRGRNRESK